MIEKLEQNQIFMPVEIAQKINELIDEHNKLEHHFNDLTEAYRHHYHLTEDGVGPTTGPNQD